MTDNSQVSKLKYNNIELVKVATHGTGSGLTLTAKGPMKWSDS